ncbi:hypothetical protein AB6C74_02180 [Vibrio splendidus]
MSIIVHFTETVSIVRKQKSDNYLHSASVKSTEYAVEKMRQKIAQALRIKEQEQTVNKTDP